MDDYYITQDLSEMDFNVIHREISQSYWAKGIPKHTLKKAMANSLCFGILSKDNQQVGFARVITDKATYAYLADVFIIDQYRGLGLSKSMMNTITHHPELQGLRRMMLATRDAHGLYQQFGFTAVENPEILMQIWQPSIYQETRG